MKLEWAFWSSVGLMIYVYCGYPAILWVVNLFTVKRRPWDPERLPAVTIVISARNEADCIQSTIENKLNLNYPAQQLEILVTSDESTDGTDEIVKSFEARGVRLIRQAPRQGKTIALNRMVAEAKGEIIVFSDANSIYQQDAVLKLVRNFSDPAVGYVTGRMVYADEARSIVGAGCTVYMRYENVLRSLESEFGSVIGVDGGIDAARKSLYEPMPAATLPDFVLPLRVIQRGYRVVYEKEALVHEATLTESADEWAMRVRVVLRSLHAMNEMKVLLNPVRYPRAAFQLLSHKLLRYLAGLFQLSALVLNAVAARESYFYSVLLVTQGFFYVAALLGSGAVGSLWLPGARYAFYFCLLNAASLAALGGFLRGEKQVVWNPRKGKSRTNGGK